MLPKYYEFHNPVKIISGSGSVDGVSYECKLLGSKKALIITDKGVSGAGLIQKIVNSFDSSDVELSGVFDDVPQDSSIHVVNNIAKIYQKEHCDVLIAVGGGSVLDTAKGVNIVVSENAEDLTKFMGMDRLENKLKPFIAIPTTSGTGSEVTSAAVISNPDKNIKMSFTSSFLYPDVAILDSDLTLSLPPKLTAATGMDALTHAIEAYTSVQKNPLSDSYALMSIKMIMENIYEATTNGKDKNARLIMLNASTMAGISFSNSMVGVVHALAHATGGVCHLPHGMANAIFLPFGIEFNSNKLAALYAEIYRFVNPKDTFNTNQEGADKLVKSIRILLNQLNQACGLPTTLKEAGIDKNKIEEIAKTVMNDGTIVYNEEKITYEDSLALLNKAYNFTQ